MLSAHMFTFEEKITVLKDSVNFLYQMCDLNQTIKQFSVKKLLPKKPDNLVI